MLLSLFCLPPRPPQTNGHRIGGGAAAAPNRKERERKKRDLFSPRRQKIAPREIRVRPSGQPTSPSQSHFNGEIILLKATSSKEGPQGESFISRFALALRRVAGRHTNAWIGQSYLETLIRRAELPLSHPGRVYGEEREKARI